MLTPKQSPFALIGMFLACLLAEGEPEPGKLIIAFLTVIVTVLYVIVCNEVNRRRNEKRKSELYR